VSLISGAVGYILVTLVRNIIDAPRPYEMYSFYESKPKSKAGRSFPSRHIYCSFATAGLLFAVHPLLFVGMLLFALVMCFCRVLLGIHFIRDAVTGALIGSVSGAIAALIILI
jgi:membrane-associated phospholipid phosphatase